MLTGVAIPALVSIDGVSAHRGTVRHTGAVRESSSSLVTVRVIARDFALQGPDTLGAGRVEFELRNEGRKEHELVVGLLRPNTTTADIIAAHRRGLTLRQLPNAYLDGMPGGALLASPGTMSSATLTVALARGRDYLLLCQFRDTIGAPSHALLGMFHVVHVK
jgi:hypothetical protein